MIVEIRLWITNAIIDWGYVEKGTLDGGRGQMLDKIGRSMCSGSYCTLVMKSEV